MLFSYFWKMLSKCPWFKIITRLCSNFYNTIQKSQKIFDSNKTQKVMVLRH